METNHIYCISALRLFLWLLLDLEAASSQHEVVLGHKV